jgi:hypothetical protein
MDTVDGGTAFVHLVFFWTAEAASVDSAELMHMKLFPLQALCSECGFLTFDKLLPYLLHDLTLC